MEQRRPGHGEKLKRQFLDLIPDRDEDLLEGLTGRRIEHLGAIERGERASETEGSRDRTSPIAQAVLQAGGLGENRYATEPYAGPYMSEEQIREFGDPHAIEVAGASTPTPVNFAQTAAEGGGDSGEQDGGGITYQVSDGDGQ